MTIEELIAELPALLDTALVWVQQTLFVPRTLAELVGVVVALLVGFAVAVPIKKRLEEAFPQFFDGHGYFDAVLATWLNTLGLALSCGIVWIGIATTRQAGVDHPILALAGNLLGAWVSIRFLTALVPQPFISKLIAIGAFSVAALNLAGALEPTMTMLEATGISLGETHITLLGIIKALVVGVVLWQVGSYGANLAESRIGRTSSLTPSVRVLLQKSVRVIVFGVVVIVALNSLGVNLTSLAVFSGALGVGLGFGLQKIFANLISGFILLMDKSIKPGDVIEIGDVFGWITRLNARYAAVVSRDGTEYLIPNEQLITNQVVNWSFSDTNVRFKAPFGVSYNADLQLTTKLAIEAAQSVDRVLAAPPPVCWIKEFGDNSVNLEIRFWVSDPERGKTNVTGQVYMALWDKLHEANIEIPFPQRDIHLKSITPQAAATLKGE